MEGSPPSAQGKGKYSIHKKCDVSLLRFNVVLFKNCLGIKDQKRLMKHSAEIMEVGDNPKLLERKKFTSTVKKAVPVLFWNWPAVKQSLTYRDLYTPDEMLELSTMLFDKAREKIYANNDSLLVSEADSKGFRFPDAYHPNALYGIMYPYDGSFIPHVDGAKGWVLAISLGESATFFMCEHRDGERVRVRLDSGDAIIFKGGTLYHGVERIFPNTAPSFWTEENNTPFSKWKMARFNLQFRDPERDRLSYYPVFEDIKK